WSRPTLFFPTSLLRALRVPDGFARRNGRPAKRGISLDSDASFLLYCIHNACSRLPRRIRTYRPFDGLAPWRSSLRSHRPAGDRRDRKSTRLNSSHDQISYAVFCLKKKKKKKKFY